MCILYDRTEEIEYNNVFESVVFARGGGVYTDMWIVGLSVSRDVYVFKLSENRLIHMV